MIVAGSGRRAADGSDGRGFPAHAAAAIDVASARTDSCRRIPALLLAVARDVGWVFAERSREVDLVLLLLPENLPNVLGDRVFAHRLTLLDAVAIRANRVVLVVE